ncbi:MAG: hypothetical protein JXA60_12370 [Candidatus Coatesbacteria bacterium]|nr:hypothetical protein [Candidatus Coatesbacteria bacterium]
MKKLVLMVLLVFFIGSLDASIFGFLKKKDKNKKEEKKVDAKKKTEKKKTKKDKEVKKNEKTKKPKIIDKKKQVKEKAKNNLKKKKEDVKRNYKNFSKTLNKKVKTDIKKTKIERDVKKINKNKPDDKTKQIKKPEKRNLEKEKKAKSELNKNNKKPTDNKKVNLKTNKPDKKTLKPNPGNKGKLNLDTKKKPDNKNLNPKPNKNLDNKKIKDSPKVGPRKDENYKDSRNTPSSTPIKPPSYVLPASNVIPNKSLGNIINKTPNSKATVNKPNLISNNWGFDILLGAGQMISTEARKQNDLYGIEMPFDYSINAGIAPYQILMGDNVRLRSLIHWEGQNIGDYSLGQVMIGTGPQYIFPRVLKIPVESSVGTRAGIAIGYSVIWNGGKKDIEFLKASFSPFVEPYVMLKSRLMNGLSVGTEFSYMKPVSSKEFSIESNGHKYNLKTGDLGGVRARFVISLNPRF